MVLRLAFEESEIEAELALEEERLFALRLDSDRQELELLGECKQLFAETVEAMWHATCPSPEER